MAQYLPVLALLILAALFAALSFVASKLLAPRNPTVEKYAPYECGIIPGREPPERFPVRFYLVAMLFVRFGTDVYWFWYAPVGSLGTLALGALLVLLPGGDAPPEDPATCGTDPRAGRSRLR